MTSQQVGCIYFNECAVRSPNPYINMGDFISRIMHTYILNRPPIGTLFVGSFWHNRYHHIIAHMQTRLGRLALIIPVGHVAILKKPFKEPIRI